MQHTTTIELTGRQTGKTTIMLGALCALAREGIPALYVAENSEMLRWVQAFRLCGPVPPLLQLTTLRYSGLPQALGRARAIALDVSPDGLWTLIEGMRLPKLCQEFLSRHDGPTQLFIADNY